MKIQLTNISVEIMYFVFPKGGDTMVKVGGIKIKIRKHNIAVGVSPQPPRGVWGHAPQKIFLIWTLWERF